MSYQKYERLQFQSAGAVLYANLYYPSKNLPFQEKHPLVIWAHGIGSQRDLDLRVPVEFTKRGFFVVALDYQGHGESEGNILNIDEETGVPALAEDCSNFLNYFENTDVFKTRIDKDQIGLIGHSLGGMVVLMNGALDKRFKAIVTWAALVNPDQQMFGLTQDHPLVQYFPVNLLNKQNTENLLAFHHIYDELLNFSENALVLQELTGCQLVKIEEKLPFSNHTLLSSEVLIGTINWFEQIFFGDIRINGPIYLSYLMNYVLLGISLFCLLLCVIAIIRFASNYFIFERASDYFHKKNKQLIEKSAIQELKIDFMKSEIYLRIVKIGVSFFIFLLIFEISFLFLSLISFIIAPLIIIVIYFIGKAVIYLRKPKKKKRKKLLGYKDQIKFQLRIKVLGYALFSSITFLSLYYLFSISYPFAFFFPSNILSTILAITIYPLYLAMELFYRKIIYPLLDFIQSNKYRVYTIAILSIINYLFLMALAPKSFIINSILVTFLISLVVVIINALIYERTEQFSSVIITSFIIIQVFFGAAVQQVLSVESFLFNFL
ncbi:MAG: alpha/beta hydrolase family protein [Promethearchaeota archaeon]